MISDLRTALAAGAWPVAMQYPLYRGQLQALLLLMLPLLLWQGRWLPAAALWGSAAGLLLTVLTAACLLRRGRFLWAIPLLIGAYLAMLVLANLSMGHGLDAMTAGCLLLIVLVSLSFSVPAGLLSMAGWLLLLAVASFGWSEPTWNNFLTVNLLLFCAAFLSLAMATRLRRALHEAQQQHRRQVAQLRQFAADLADCRASDAGMRECMEQGIAQQTAQLQAANQHLRETNLQMEAFNYMVSHDMRASLRIMDGFAKALADDLGKNISTAVRHDLERLQAAIRHMHGMVVELLKLSRAGDVPLSLQRVDLSALAHELVWDLRRLEPERRVEVDIADNVCAYAAPVLMREVLQNLLFNAWKFTARRSHARIQFGVYDDADGRVFYVSDNGAGFDMNRTAELFKPFKRLHAAQEFEGTGLGLMTVKRIIERHGGRVWAIGVPEQGARLCFSLGESVEHTCKAAMGR